VAPQRLVGIARRWLPILVLGMVLPSLAAFLLSSTQPQVYQVSATLIPAQLRVAGDPDVSTVATSRLVGMSTNYSYTAKSPELLSTIGRQLSLPDAVDELTKRIDATVSVDTAVLTITARAGTASAAADLANAVAKAIEEQSTAVQNDEALVANLATIRERMLETETEYQRLLDLPPPRTPADTAALGNSLTLLRELTSVYDSLSGSLKKTPGGLVVVNAADPHFAIQIAPRTVYYAILAGVAGLLIAAAIASFLEYLDDRVKSPEDVEAAADMRTLGTIGSAKGRRGRPKAHGLATLVDPRSAVAEAYRTVRTSLEFAAIDAPIRTLLVTSSLPGEGKTVTAANLAVAFAQAGRRVLLVDADLRKPGVHQLFDADNAHGLTTLLRTDDVTLDGIAQGTKQANLRILTTGPLPPNPAELLGAQRMRTVLDRLRAGSDLVIFDGPPLQVVTDSAILSSFLDGTLFVIAAGRSRLGEVRRASELLARAHATVLGAVLIHGAGEASPRYPDDTRAPSETPAVAARAGERANPT
jgi:non-specific protein-tyrosine kinase